jgi:phosphosulfolactate synthase
MSATSWGTGDLVRAVGVEDRAPATMPFDPGYDPVTLESHLDQSAHLMLWLKLSMASWLLADPPATARKLAGAHRHGVPVTAGGGPFEIAAATGRLPEYLDLCAGLGFAGIEAGEGFTDLDLDPADVVAMASARGLAVQYEIGKKRDGPFTARHVAEHLRTGQRWLDAGAHRLVVEARESATGVGLFDADGHLDATLAERFAEAFGLTAVCFEAPTKQSQFAFLDHFGPEVVLGNVRLEELLRVECYRRGLHADSFERRGLASSEARLSRP